MRAAWILVALSAGCYGLGAPAPQFERVFVEVVDDDGIDVDLAALVAGAARDAVAARPELVLAARADAEVVLRLELSPGTGGLSALADPARRAPDYRVELHVEGTLVGEGDRALWRSGPVVGEGGYASHPGSIVALDGARRAALAHAAQDAAQRVVGALLYAR